MVTEIRIYCEGGGDSQATKDPLRKGLSAFFRDLVNTARSKKIHWYLLLCGSRQAAYEDFRTALRTHPYAFNVLLVDAEAPVKKAPWAHLHDTDGWDALNTDDAQCHLMVQAMEAWLIVDRAALRKYYGQKFNERALPRTKNVEHIPKQKLEPALRAATRQTSKGVYNKIKHTAELLERIDSAKVRQAATHCERLFKTLQTVLTDEKSG